MAVLPSGLSKYKSYFRAAVAAVPDVTSFVFGHIERPIAGTRSELTYPLFHLQPPLVRAINNDANYFALKFCGTFVIWCLGDTDDWDSQDNAWDLSLALSMEVIKKMQHDCNDGLIDEFDESTVQMEMVKPLWVDRGYGWEVYFEFQIPVIDELC